MGRDGEGVESALGEERRNLVAFLGEKENVSLMVKAMEQEMWLLPNR